ncbi:hypothetical protein E5676_scaffold3445G00150 [Cucumis melo var. makuwa]|uniref:Uncharacterized protein n=1 Tax=Cucumis melo var. makuwa TaxID=1194695 RepID=A0A5D3DWL3_CUCMM|nr:hypothetical protein E6C27_scaffold4784G00060 [Cucumis melo var. makuwa]TYK27630.1 hypothetical protein E5676_scaffold3445G00150 [Cucumis melo var. makuwa]
MFLEFESWKKAWIFKGASIFEGVLEVGVFEENLYLQRSFNLRGSNSAVSDPTSIGGQSGFCRQIHRPDWSDRTPSSFEEVILLSAIQLLSGDDRTFAVRSTTLIHRPGRSDWAPSSFGEVILSSAIQLLSGDDLAFAVRSIALVEAIGHLRRLERGDTAVNNPTSIGGRSSFCRQIHHLVGAIGHLRPLERGDTVVWIGTFAINDLTSIEGRSGFGHQICHLGRSDWALSSFRKVEVKMYHRHHLREAKAELHRRCPLKATTY